MKHSTLYFRAFFHNEPSKESDFNPIKRTILALLIFYEKTLTSFTNEKIEKGLIVQYNQTLFSS
ncbi:MAG: hypothetical protein AB8G11_17595 [Saprospiraceae bacterium]